MSVLVDTDIRHLVAANELITEFSGSVEGASYDMRLGPQYTKAGVNHTLTTENPTLVLLEGEFAVLRSLEELNIPLDLIGHNGIMSPWAKRGLVSLFSPQIDPGFEGFLTVPVFNAGDAPISLNFGQKIFTVEFAYTNKPASFGWAERHGRQDRMDIPYSPTTVRPNLADLADMRAELQQWREQAQRLSDSHRDVVETVNVMKAQLGGLFGRREYKQGSWMLIWTIAATGIAVLALAVAFFSSDYLRSKIGFPPPAQVENGRANLPAPKP